MRNLVRTGAVIQAASALTLVAQNILAPRLMGAEQYGAAVGILAVPLLLQGSVEPMVNGAAIAARSRDDHYAVVRTVFVHLGWFVPVAMALALAFAALREAQTAELLLLCVFVALVLPNTALRGIAFSGQRHRILAAHYVAAFAATVASTPLLARWGTMGYVAMMCLVQIVELVILLSDSTLKNELGRIMRASANAPASFAYLRNYAANLSQRLTALTLGPGLVTVASTQLSTPSLAEFRVCQTLAGALAYLVPVNATLIQAHTAAARREPRRGNPDSKQALLRLVALSVLVLSIATGALWYLYPDILHFLLDRGVTDTKFRSMILGAPFFVATRLLAGWLLGRGLETASLVVSVLAVTATMGVAVLLGASKAFVLGSLAATAAYLTAIWVLRGKRVTD